MIIGDPYLFALEFQYIKYWNTPNCIWRNGMFSLYIDGIKFPPRIDTVELKTSLGTYLGMNFTKFNDSIITINSDELFTIIKRYVMQADEESVNDFKKINALDLTCTTLEDQGCYIYLVRMPECECLLWTTDWCKTMQKFYLPFGTVENIIINLPSFEQLDLLSCPNVQA